MNNAHWYRLTTPPNRWQALQTRLSREAATTAAHWMRFSPASLRWRVVSAAVLAKRG